MRNLSMARGVIAGSVFLALILMVVSGIQGQSPSQGNPITISPARADDADTPNDPSHAIEKVIGEKETREILDHAVDFKISDTLDNLPSELRKRFGLLVVLDTRGVEYSQQPLVQAVELDETAIPLRAALRRILQPMGLKAVVESDEIVITADLNALAHMEIGTSKWVNVDTEVEKKIAKKLDSETAFQFDEVPLNSVLEVFSEMHDLPILLDVPALIDIGLSDDVSVTLSLESTKLSDALGMILNPHDLTYTIHNNVLMVTSEDAAANQLLTRIYWLEETGFTLGDDASALETILSTIAPESWSEAGGEGTIGSLNTVRPAMIVCTTYRTHREIGQLFRALRESHFGKSPTSPPQPMGSAEGDGSAGGGGGMF